MGGCKICAPVVGCVETVPTLRLSVKLCDPLPRHLPPHPQVEIAKSSLVYEVKPLEAGQDMAEMDRRVRAIELDGLVWGGDFKVVDVAYGIQKLVVACIIEDEKVSLEDFEEKLLAMEDIVSSVDLINMNKVCRREIACGVGRQNRLSKLRVVFFHCVVYLSIYFLFRILLAGCWALDEQSCFALLCL